MTYIYVNSIGLLVYERIFCTYYSNLHISPAFHSENQKDVQTKIWTSPSKMESSRLQRAEKAGKRREDQL